MLRKNYLEFHNYMVGGFDLKNVLEYLENIACSNLGTNTVRDLEREISYIELLRTAQGIGVALLHVYGYDAGAQGVFYEPPRRPVLVLMNKGVNALAAFMGIVYAGCFYVLLNPDLPDERIRKILEVTAPEILITDLKNFHRAVSLTSARPLQIEKICNHVVSTEEQLMLEEVRKRQIDTDPLYANFTSGSTGVPKGVLVSHRSVIDFIDQFTKIFEITSEDVIGNQAPFDFDVSVKDIYSALKTGAKLVLVDKDFFSKPAELMDYLCESGITVMTWAVSALCLITTFHALDYRVPYTVKKVLFSGEVMPRKHLREWMNHLPEATFVNLYGPTEVTCNCTYHIIDRNRNYESGIPIGKAFPNERVFLLDENDCLILPNGNRMHQANAEGETGTDKIKRIGEICVTGSSLALGYYNAEQETEKTFVKNPANSAYNERIYRTGDLAYYDENQELCFSGRKDFQIKHMGHRIELEEIERSIMAVDGIERSCCVFDESKGRLTGFYVGVIESRKLHELLLSTLPAFMVPGALRPLKEMPITKNGKIDRKLLLVLAKDKAAYKKYIS